MVINAMEKSPISDKIMESWKQVARDLEVGQDVIDRTRKNWLYESWSKSDIMIEVLTHWRAIKATEAKLTVFLEILDRNKLKDISYEIRKIFFPNLILNDQQTRSQLQACVYLRMPSSLPELFPGQVSTIPIEYGLTTDVNNSSKTDESNFKPDRSCVPGKDFQFRRFRLAKNMNVSVKIEKQAKKEDDFYKLPGIEKGNGYALILNIIRYDSPSAGYREGAQYDSFLLTQLFTQLGYEVIKYDDPHFYYTKDDVKRIITNFRDYIRNMQPPSLIVFIGCYGQMEQIRLSDETYISLFTSVVYPFDAKNCPTLKDVPKIFISNSSRDNPTYSGPGFNNIFNTIMCYSASPGQHSFRDRRSGSHYIRHLVKVFAENAYRLNLVELLEMTQRELCTQEINIPGRPPGFEQQNCMYVKLGDFKTFYFNF